MEFNIALFALIFWIGVSLAVAAYLDHRQHQSRRVPVLRPVYRRDRRGHRW